MIAEHEVRTISQNQAFSRSQTFQAYLELTKPRLSILSVITALVGYLAADPSKDIIALGAVLLGTSLAAGGAGALNQWFERYNDALMARTKNRPIPQGVITPRDALTFGLTLSILGTGILWLGANALAAALVALTLLSYVLVYTPLKRVSSWSTIIGAIPGALPPLVGWAAANDSIGPLGWVLFGILFCWQIPHFMAIAWMYREDYRRGGLMMTTVEDPSGQSAGRQAIAYAALLLAISILPAILGDASWLLYGTVATLAGLWFLKHSITFYRAHHARNKPARSLFFASIIYLPFVLAILVIDRILF